MSRPAKELNVDFQDETNCFGKLYDNKSADCKKCTDGADCKAWQAAKGNPNGEIIEESATIAHTGKKNPGQKSNTKAADKQDKQDKAVDKPVQEQKIKTPAKGTAKAPTEKSKSAGASNLKRKEVEKDKNGFAVGSKASKIYAMIEAGNQTRQSIEEAVDSVGKTTVSVFLGDVQRPVGTTSVSRGVKVNKSDKGILSFAK